MNPISIIRIGRFADVQKYLTVTNHIFTPYVWVMNAAFHSGLSQEEHAWVAAAARAGVEASRTIARELVTSERGLPALAQRMNVYQPTPEELEDFRRVSQPAIRNLIAETMGAEGLELLSGFLEAIKAAQQ